MVSRSHEIRLGMVPTAKPLGESLDQELPKTGDAQLSFGSTVYLSGATMFEE
jgi:hypothetical protein